MYTTKQKLDEIVSDDNGAYLHTSSTSKEYVVEFDSSSSLTSRIVHMDASGEFYYKKRNGRSYDVVQVEKDTVFMMHRYYRKSKSFPGLRQMIVRVSPIHATKERDYCCVIYSYSGDVEAEREHVLPHGNATKRSRPYVKTTKETLSKIDAHLLNGKTTQETYDLTLEESGGPMKSKSQSEQPRDQKQINNRKNQVKEKEKSGQTNENDHLYVLLQQLHEIDLVRTITVKRNSVLFILMTDEMVNDIKQFCCGNNASVLGIDTTFNLCDMWVTDTCYRNQRLTNPENGQHPIFLGPTLFHFTKDEQTFSRLALEMVDADPALNNIKSIGVDLEEAISKGFKRIVSNADILYCVRHLQQRDHDKLEKLSAGIKASASEKNRAKSEILKDIYGERNGACYEYGLAESLNQEEFSKKLGDLKIKWKGLCPGFYKWFCEHRSEKFIDSVICTARDGTNVTGLYYQNDIEALHFVEKKRQHFRKENVITAIKGLKTLTNQQRVEEARALHGAGRYELSTTHQKFFVDSSKWHSWSEERRSNHIRAFHNFQPSFSDKFKKPKTAGRKPNYQKKTRSVTPDIIQDRHEYHQTPEILDTDPPLSIQGLQQPAQGSQQPAQGSQQQAQGSQQPAQGSQQPAQESQPQIRFQDPRNTPEKMFELFFRKNLSRAIKKCQGNCGRKITPEDPTWLVKTFGQAKWTDKSTGKEKTKYGAMYLHFQSECLKSFDNGTFYGISKDFDYKRITIDKANQNDLNSDERSLLIQLGVKFL